MHDHDDAMNAAIHPEAGPPYHPEGNSKAWPFMLNEERNEIRAELSSDAYAKSEWRAGWTGGIAYADKGFRVRAFLLGMVCGVALIGVALFLTSCRRETPVAKEPAVTTAYPDTMGADPMAAATATAPEAETEWRDDTPGAFALDVMMARESPSARRVTLLGQQPAETRTVHVATPAVPLRAFRVDDHAPMTVDGFTYRRPRFSFVAIDIADAMRSESECLFADWQPALARGTCFWPDKFSRGPWMVVPIDASAVVQFRRRAGANILSPINIAELPAIAEGELK